MASRSDGVVRWGWPSGNDSGGTESPPPRTASSIFAKYENRAVLSSPLKGEEAIPARPEQGICAGCDCWALKEA